MPRIKFGELNDTCSRFIAQFPFEWFSTFTFKDPVSQEIGGEKVLQWIRKICTEEHMQVGFISVVNEVHRIHNHLLMLGRNRAGLTLSSVSKEKWAKYWCKKNLCYKKWQKKECRKNCIDEMRWNIGAKISDVYEIMGVSRYLTRNLIVKDPALSDVFIYNKKLLEKCGLKSFPA